ncbi:hypothetical protein ACFQ40_02095 [Kroppenstedtia eburnea]|uniref:hypothetical protein n=1 Tax=Kroppenstedtia eburnea TaxID=714067 RepID=UPI00362981B0
MANGRMILSKQGEERLGNIMVELNLKDRPEALRLAFAKGIAETTSEPSTQQGKAGWTIPQGVVAKGDDYLLYKHLLIEKLKRPLENEEVDTYLLRYIESGLEIMQQEIDGLSSLDNYLLMLVEQAEKKSKEVR